MSKKILSVILPVVFILSSITCYAADIKNSNESLADGDIFIKDNVIDINIEIRDADLQDMYDYAINEEYHSADITMDGVKVENAGIQTKGNMTLSSVANSDSNRYSFRIKFDKYVKNQTYLGFDELCLNNCYIASNAAILQRFFESNE